MPGEPATLKEALESSDAEEWKKAMESELKSIEENGTWELVELPEGRKAITSKWLFKIKSDADGKIERYKSRLVAKGYKQKEKVDYKELFAPLVKPTTLRTLLAGAAIKGWVVKLMDVTTAFLNGVLEDEIFMAQPEGFDDGSGRVLRLKKALYGLKQAPRQWFLKLRGVLEEIGFTPSSAHHSLFILGEGEQRSFMVVYVDDILIFSPSSDLVKEVMLKLQDKFKCKALGDCVKGPEEESVGEEERCRFHSLVGSLMYAAVNTRPDVAFATGQLARVVQCPNEEQVAAGMRVAKYLGQTTTVGLQYSAAVQRRQKGANGVEPGRLFLTAFSDASFASEPEDMTSVGGFIFCVGGGPTAWESKKQVVQALSSVESEYMALFRAVREIVWQRRLLAELGEEQQGPTPLYSDSQGATALAKNPVSHGLTKHMRALVEGSFETLRGWGHARSGGAGSGGVDSGGASFGGAERPSGGGVEGSPGRVSPGVLPPMQRCPLYWEQRRSSLPLPASESDGTGGAGAGVTSAGGTGAGGSGAGGAGAGGAGAGGPSAGGTRAGGVMAGGPGAGGYGAAGSDAGGTGARGAAARGPGVGATLRFAFGLLSVCVGIVEVEIMEVVILEVEVVEVVVVEIRHIKPFQREPEKGPKAWAALKGVHTPATAAVAVVLERQMAALRIEEDEAIEEGVQKFFDLLTRLEGADLNYSELQNKTKLLALLPESWSSLIINLNRDLPHLSLEDVKRAILQEDFRRPDLAATTSMEDAGVADMAATTRVTDAVAADSTASATIVTRADICGAIASSSLMDGPLLKAKRVEEQEEGEEEAVEAVEVAEVVLQV
ncbi:unnamed protein product [Closterium sp. NIES-53]